jgi:hypothetical protein
MDTNQAWSDCTMDGDPKAQAGDSGCPICHDPECNCGRLLCWDGDLEDYAGGQWATLNDAEWRVLRERAPLRCSTDSNAGPTGSELRPGLSDLLPAATTAGPGLRRHSVPQLPRPAARSAPLP